MRRHVSPRTDLPLDLVRIELPAGATIPMPASVYAFKRQLIWVLSGELVFVEGDARHDMAEGDCLELGPLADCRFENQSDQPCVYMVAVLSAA